MLTDLLFIDNILHMIKISSPKVKTSEAIKLAGNKARLAKALGIQRGPVSNWGEYLPPLQAARIAIHYPELVEKDSKAP